MGTAGFLLTAGGGWHSSGAILIEDNNFLNSPQGGIHVAPMISVSDTLAIRGNTIQSNAITSNPYGILLDGVHNFEVSGNTINAEQRYEQ